MSLAAKKEHLKEQFHAGTERLNDKLDTFELVRQARSSRRLLIFIVFVALFLDSMLLTAVVPIIPNFLYQKEHPELINPVDLNITNKRQIDNSTECLEMRPPPANVTLQLRKIWSDTPHIQKLDIELPPCTYHENITRLVTQIRREKRHDALFGESVKVGIMFGAKAVTQLIANPIVGTMTNRIGYSIPLFTGFCIMTVSTLVFAFADSYVILFMARALQGVGSACSSTAGMGMLALRFPDDKERGNAMGLALGGIGLGVVVGPPFGGFMYEYVSKASPFIVLAALGAFDGCLQFLVLNPKYEPEKQEGTSIIELLKDPYILITSFAIMLGNVGIAILEPSLPIWMYDTMDSPKWQQGAAFLPASVSYLIGTNLFGPVSHRIGRWRSAMIGMAIVGFSLILIPLAKNIYHLIVPNFCLGFSIGMIDSAMMPQMGYLVDHRHVSVYGSVYAIADVSFCLGFAVGPAFSGEMMQSFGFKGMLWFVAGITLCYVPFLYFLKDPPGKDSNLQSRLEAGPLKATHTSGGQYEQFQDEDDENESRSTQQNGYETAWGDEVVFRGQESTSQNYGGTGYTQPPQYNQTWE